MTLSKINKEQNFKLPMNLQTFSDEDDKAAEEKAAAEAKAAEEKAAEEKAAADAKAAKQFSQDDVDKVAGKTRKQAIAKFVKDYGMTEDEAAAALKSFKENKEKNQTELEKKDAAITAANEKIAAAEAKATAAEQKVVIATNNVKADSINDVTTLAASMVSDDMDFDEAVKKVIEKYPSFVNDGNDDGFQVGKGQKGKKGKKDPQFSLNKINR